MIPTKLSTPVATPKQEPSTEAARGARGTPAESTKVGEAQAAGEKLLDLAAQKLAEISEGLGSLFGARQQNAPAPPADNGVFDYGAACEAQPQGMQDPFAGADKAIADEALRRAIAQDPFEGADKAIADEAQRRAIAQDPFAGADKAIADEAQRRAIAQDPFEGADKAIADEAQRRTAATAGKPEAAVSRPAATTAPAAKPDLGQLADRLIQLKLINAGQAAELKNGKATDADIAALSTAINNTTANIPDAAKLLIELGNAQQAVNTERAAQLGIGQAGAVDPKEFNAMKRSQQAVVDAGVSHAAMQPGESLQDLATRYDTSVDELKQLNPQLAADLARTDGKAARAQFVAVPVASSDVRAAPVDLSQISESGPNAYQLAAPSLDDIKKAQGATMIRGMSGADVKELQRMLNAQGANPPLALDGKFGPKTEAMLKAYQSSNGIQQTGVLGPQTLQSFSASPRPITAQAAADAAASTSGAVSASGVSGAELSGSAFGDKLGDAAQRIAQRMNSVGACAKGVNDALTSLGVPGRGHAYQKAEQLAGNPRFREANVSSGDLARLPRGAVVVWGRSGAKPHGHVSVALGGGREASDHVQNQIRGGRYGTDFGNGPDPQGRQFRVFLPA